MYSIKRMKLFSGISNGRESVNKHKYQLLNHLVLFMLSYDYLDYDNHWSNEVINFIKESISWYDNKSFRKNFSFNELFDDFINKGKDYNSFISRLKEKFRDESRNNPRGNIKYPSEFIDSDLLRIILKDLSNKLNSWKRVSNRKPILSVDSKDYDYPEFIKILFDLRNKYKSQLDEYALMYNIRTYSSL